MNFGLLFGVFLILFGISIVLNAFFGIDIPVGRTALAILLIYWGISMITGKSACSSSVCYTSYSSKSYTGTSNTSDSFNTVMGEQKIDASTFGPFDTEKTITINTVFGSTRLKLDNTVPTKIMINTVFGTTKLPNGNAASLGEILYETEPNAQPKLIIKGNVVFGSLQIEE